MTAAPGPLWQLRVNPLRRTRLSDPALRDLLADLVAAERAVRAAADDCSEELYGLIGTAADGADRRHLVDVRRAIHNDRVPKGPVPDTAAVARWSAAHGRRQALRERVADGYDGAADRERVTLCALLADDDLRRSLALVAPEVFAEAERYRAAVAGDAPLSARARKSERGLVQYVTRALLRTSPLARLTAVGIAVADPDGPAPDAAGFPGATAVPSLDRVMLGYVLGALDASGPPGDDAWIGLSPTGAVDEEAGKIFFLRPTPQGLQRVAAGINPMMRVLVDATAMGPRPMPSLTAHVSATLACTVAQAGQVVAGAVAGGLLCSYTGPEDGAADLDAVLTRPGSVAAEPLAEVRTGLARLAAAPPGERGTELDALNAALARVSHLAGRPARIPVEEDYVLAPGTVAAGPWHARLDDLAAAVELFTLFDWLHDVRAMTTGAFVARFGRGASVALTDNARALADDVDRRVAAADDVSGNEGDPAALAGLGTDDGALERIYALRRRVIDATTAAIGKAVDAGEPELVLSRADVLTLTDGLPDRFRRDPLSYGVLVQGAGDRLVFNDGLPGHGMLFSRFLDADRKLGGDATARLRDRLVDRYGWDGSRVVEDLGLHRLNVNAHPRVLPDGLRPDDWYTLRLVHDADADRLRIETADGERLCVLPLGTGHPALFPAPLSIASNLVTGGRLNNYLVDLWHSATSWDGRHTRATPRVLVGDVVIARRRWYGGGELAAALAADERDRLLALTAWRARHDVPAEVMVKTTFLDGGPRTLKATEVLNRRTRHKPQYVDLTCALSTRVLPRMLDRRAEANTVQYLEEALPGVVDGTHAVEWAVEIARRPGGPFRYEGETR